MPQGSTKCQTLSKVCVGIKTVNKNKCNTYPERICRMVGIVDRLNNLLH